MSPPITFETIRYLQKSQMGSSHKAPTSFREGEGWIKERENVCPIIEGEGGREHSPSHPHTRHKAMVPPLPGQPGLST